MSRKQSRVRGGSASPRGGAERSEAEALGDAARGRPGRRSAAERTQAVLDLEGGETTAAVAKLRSLLETHDDDLPRFADGVLLYFFD